MRKVPKPVIVTLSPFLRDVVMVASIASRAIAASFLVMLAAAAAALIKSCLVIFVWG